MVMERNSKATREILLDEVDMGVCLFLAADASDIIAQAAGSTNHDAHCAYLVLNLHADESVDVRSSGEHLDRGAGAVDFLRVTRPCDEEHDPENVSPVVHPQDGRHPGSDPFQMLG